MCITGRIDEEREREKNYKTSNQIRSFLNVSLILADVIIEYKHKISLYYMYQHFIWRTSKKILSYSEVV